MKTVAIASVVCITAALIAPSTASEKQPIIVVADKTIVAFFPPVSKAELEKDPDTNETLSDFQQYAKSVREPLKKAGIEFHELYARSFRLRIGQSVTTFRPAKMEVGYYFTAPAKKPRIEYGVMTGYDLLQLARQYFGADSWEYRLDDSLGKIALYPGQGYRSYIREDEMVSSLDELKRRVGLLPKGTRLYWRPFNWGSSGQPILFSEGQSATFEKFCRSREIELIVDSSQAKQ